MLQAYSGIDADEVVKESLLHDDVSRHFVFTFLYPLSLCIGRLVGVP